MNFNLTVIELSPITCIYGKLLNSYFGDVGSYQLFYFCDEYVGANSTMGALDISSNYDELSFNYYGNTEKFDGRSDNFTLDDMQLGLWPWTGELISGPLNISFIRT